jgi:hypothetical protein
MATTTKGIYYPTSSDNIAPLESHFATLASSVDTAVSKIVAGKTNTFTGPADAGTSVARIDIPYGKTFASIPSVNAILVGGSSAVGPYTVVLYGLTNTTFSAKVFRTNGTGAETGLALHWTAIEG